MNKTALPAAFVLTALLALVSSLTALPRLSIEHAVACGACHVNPNGGGMRTEFGNVSVAANELVLPQTKKLMASHVRSPRVSENLQIGFDSRHLVFDDGRIFRMQTDVFAAVTPFDNFHYQIRFWQDGITENYALLYFSDEKYYVKAGRFYPAFGLRNADHTAYNRMLTGHGPTLYLDGLSVGSKIGGLSLVAEGFDVQSQSVLGGHAYYNTYLAPVSLFGGGSVRWSERVGDSTNLDYPHAKALFGGINYDRFTFMGEIDVVGRGNDTLITYSSFTTRIEYGLYLIGEYNFFDGDRSNKSGVEEFVRVSVEFFPVPFVELRPSYTYYTRGTLKDQDDFFVQFHFGY